MACPSAWRRCGRSGYARSRGLTYPAAHRTMAPAPSPARLRRPWPRDRSPAGRRAALHWPSPRPVPARPLRDHPALLFGERSVDVQHEGVGVGPRSATMKEALCFISPEMKCTSRDRRSSFATITGALASRAASNAAWRRGRFWSSSLPLCNSVRSGRSGGLPDRRSVDSTPVATQGRGQTSLASVSRPGCRRWLSSWRPPLCYAPVVS
jgi:hypothetical protein